jgi:hypothetical protein
MSYMPTVAISIDGVDYVVKLAQGDYVRAEQDGIDPERFDRLDPTAIAKVSFHALHRAKRKGLIDASADIPESWDDFLDAFEFSNAQPEAEDPEGKDSGQVPTPG